MRSQFAVLLFILAIFGFSSCSQPVGSISSSGSSEGEFSGFYILAKKDTYYLSDPNKSVFWRNDAHIFIVGNVDLYNNSLTIEIEKTSIVGPDVHEFIDPYEKFEFAVPGEYVLRGTYNGRTAESPFEVSGSPPTTGENSAGIGMDWLP